MSLTAYVVEGEVFHIFDFSSNPFRERYLQGNANNPIFVDITNFLSIEPGDIYENGMFYPEDDINRENPRQNTGPAIGVNGEPLVNIANIANGKVFGRVLYDTSVPGVDAIVAGFLSNPICIDITNIPNVEVGSTWDGQFFNPPMN